MSGQLLYTNVCYVGYSQVTPLVIPPNKISFILKAQPVTMRMDTLQSGTR